MDTTIIATIAALVISEFLPYIPIKSNGIVELIINILKKVFSKV